MSQPPKLFHIPLSRRRLVRGLTLSAAGLWAPGAFAELLTLTPGMTEGPYYPDKLPLDQDNDLIRVTDHTSPALGTITNLSGRLLDKNGEPLKDALIELWQADDHGTYIHSQGASQGTRDPDFQGYGKFTTGKDGGWRFRTIKPGLYTGRTRHYHFGITVKGQKMFTTQLFFAGEPGNDKDGVLRGVRDEKQRASVIREFKADKDSKELAATWDIVMGWTPGDGEGDDGHDHHHGPGPGGAGGPPPPPPGGKGGPGGPPPRGERPDGPPPGGRPDGPPPSR